MSPRTQLLIAGLLAGAALAVTPPVRNAVAAWHCTHDGGRWIGEEHACEISASLHAVHDRAPSLLFEEDR